MTGNAALLKNCIHDKKNITNLNAFWGPDVKMTPLQYMLENKNLKLIEAFLHHPNLKETKMESYSQLRDKLLFGDRKTDDKYLLNVIETGRVSHMAYHAHVRSVQMTRGNR